MKSDKDKKHIHTTVSENTYDIITKLALKYGTSKSNVIEKAISLLKVREHLLDDVKKSVLDEHQMWHLMRSDFNMVAVGRTTFMSYIDKIPTEPQENNNCIELIEWFHNKKKIEALTLFEILTAISDIWIAGNYFYEIQIVSQDKTVEKPENAKKFEIAFYHNFHHMKYGKYWSQYFKTVLEKEPINCKCEIQLRNEVFYIFLSQNEKGKIKNKI